MRTELFLEQIRILLQMHANGLLGGEVMPEDALLGIVPAAELPNVLTLAMSLNYQRNAYALWQAVAKAYIDKSTRWVFDPQAASASDPVELQTALLLHRVALQPNRHPVIWQRVAGGIARSSANGDVAGLIDAAQSDIAILQNIIQHKRKSDFPYLSGPKIFNYWLYVMESYAGIVWRSRELITIAPDTHILQASVKLGICSEGVLNGTAEDRHYVAEAWETALRGSGLAPIDVHTPLWLWSRAGFPPLIA
ncbi:hypothetical protein [Paenibacillus pedocola]|uniref:hypothetical protein n=1 Tax=Paenibacillus pedocola TaxID=3242193 RepID=UPI002877FEE1|nr:hypothetical protein [Paenibacillus typhae]